MCMTQTFPKCISVYGVWPNGPPWWKIQPFSFNLSKLIFPPFADILDWIYKASVFKYNDSGTMTLIFFYFWYHNSKFFINSNIKQTRYDTVNHFNTFHKSKLTSEAFLTNELSHYVIFDRSIVYLQSVFLFSAIAYACLHAPILKYCIFSFSGTLLWYILL